MANKKSSKSRVIGSHTSTNRHFLVTEAYRHRIRHTALVAPKNNPRPEQAARHGDGDLHAIVQEECPASLKIRRRAKRYINSVSNK
jgi:hypothetical protein